MQVQSSDYDELIETYIGMVEAEVSAYIDRPLALGTYTEVPKITTSQFDHSEYTPLDTWQAGSSYYLRNYPVLQASFSGVDEDAYTIDLENGVVTPTGLSYPTTATYVAGYTTATLPTDLKMIIMLGTKSMYENNSASAQGKGDVKSKSVKHFSVNYGNAQSGYVTESKSSNGAPILVKNYIASNQLILNRYRRIDL